MAFWFQSPTSTTLHLDLVRLFLPNSSMTFQSPTSTTLHLDEAAEAVVQTKQSVFQSPTSTTLHLDAESLAIDLLGDGSFNLRRAPHSI